jgi:hypothetical protein
LPLIGNLPAFLQIPSKTIHHFQGKVNTLSDYINDTQNVITDLENEIISGSTKGLGTHLADAQAHLNALNYHHQREQNKIDLYRFEIDELRKMYQRAVTIRANSGTAHPVSHPKNVHSELTSKAAFIESLTEDYGYEPMHIIQAYHHQQGRSVGGGGGGGGGAGGGGGGGGGSGAGGSET